METDTAILARITGRVQGIGFRAWTRKNALALGLHGWVRNELDGSVTALVVGPQGNVAELLRILQAGPPTAVIRGLSAAPIKPEPRPLGFSITR